MTVVALLTVLAPWTRTITSAVPITLQLTREIKEKDSSGVWRPLLAYKNLIRAIEHLGISMVFGEEYFGRGDLDHTSYLNFVTNDALGQDFLNASKSFAFWIKDR